MEEEKKKKEAEIKQVDEEINNSHVTTVFSRVRGRSGSFGELLNVLRRLIMCKACASGAEQVRLRGGEWRDVTPNGVEYD